MEMKRLVSSSLLLVMQLKYLVPNKMNQMIRILMLEINHREAFKAQIEISRRLQLNLGFF